MGGALRARGWGGAGQRKPRKLQVNIYLYYPFDAMLFFAILLHSHINQCRFHHTSDQF
jgi:hypothetical protein